VDKFLQASFSSSICKEDGEKAIGGLNVFTFWLKMSFLVYQG